MVGTLYIYKFIHKPQSCLSITTDNRQCKPATFTHVQVILIPSNLLKSLKAHET